MDDRIKELIENRKRELGVRKNKPGEPPHGGTYTPEQRENFKKEYPFWTKNRKMLIHQRVHTEQYRKNRREK